MTLPDWYGCKYPTLLDLEDSAHELDVPVLYGKCPKPAMMWDSDGPLCIIVPDYSGNLARCWAVAHELGHLVLHHGPVSKFLRDKREEEANAWAARALIPAVRIRHHQNASIGTFIAALSRHFQEIPTHDDPLRRLAAVIAQARLRHLKEVV